MNGKEIGYLEEVLSIKGRTNFNKEYALKSSYLFFVFVPFAC